MRSNRIGTWAELKAAGIFGAFTGWIVGGVLGSSCDGFTSGAGVVVIVCSGLVAATLIAAAWLRGLERRAWRWAYVVPVSLVAAAVPTGIALYAAVIAWFDNCFAI